ncbi:MAG: glycosyltransferase [Fermentimonas sp.]|jgi:putative colanic acid biosynthesis glycosyltransferase
MPTLLQINVTANAGSTGRIAEEIGLKAIASGWDSYIAYGRNERPSVSKLIRVGNDMDVKLHGIQTRLFDRHGLGSKKATIEFIKKTETIKPDIIHLHNIHGYYINYPVLFSFLQKIKTPIVWTLHDCWSITGHCSHFTYIKCEKWKTQCHSCPQKSSYPASYLLDRSKKNYILKKKLFNSVSNLTLIPVSNWLSDILKESFLQNYPIKVINNGIDTKVFKPYKNSDFRDKYNLKNKFIIMGVATAWSEGKGISDYIALSKVISYDCKIVLVGLKQNQMNDVPDNIIKLPLTTNQKQLAELYSMADVVISLSRGESFGLTIVEGFACGTPGIVYNNTAQPELITLDTGYVVENDNIDDVANAINKIKNNGKKFYSNACRNRAIQYYNKDDRFEDYISLYNEILYKTK